MVVVAFLFSMLLTFGIVVLLIRPTADQKAVARRLESLKAPEAGVPSAQDLELYLKTMRKGQFAWLEDVFAGTGLPRAVQLLILQSDSTATVGAVLVKSLVFGTIGFAGVWLFAPRLLFAVPVGAIAGYAPILTLSIKRNRRIAAFNKALPDCIDIVARSLRAGHSLVAAIAIIAEQAVEPARMEFGEVYKKQNYGLPLRDALLQLLDRVPSQDLRVLVTGILVQKDTGGNLADILDRIHFVIKERMRIQGEIRIHTAQGRMTGWILCALPIVMLGLINIVNPGYSKVLFTDPLGQKMLYAGVGLLCVGGFIIRRIVNGIEV
jgi:tight adherence protein B